MEWLRVCNRPYNSELTVYKSTTSDDQHISQSAAHLTTLWPLSPSSQLCSPVQAVESIRCPLRMRDELISVETVNEFAAKKHTILMLPLRVCDMRLGNVDVKCVSKEWNATRTWGQWKSDRFCPGHPSG